jgi:hypothetical protein
MTRYHVAVILLLSAVAPPAAAQEAPRTPGPHGPALFEEPNLLTSAVEFAGRFMSGGDGEGRRDEGFYFKVGGMISGAGWISLGGGYRHYLFDGRAIADARAAVSWRGYLSADTRLEFPLLADGRFATGVEALWRDSTQINYFGLGPDSLEALRSQYRLQTLNVVTYARYRPRRWLAVSSRVGWLDGPSVSSATGPFKPDALDTQAAFPADPAVSLAHQPQFFHGEMAITADTRDFPDHPTEGGLFRASAGAYVADQRHFSFRRYEVEGVQAIPLLDRAWFLVVHGWGVFADAAPTQEIPFYLMPTLGGSNTLRGYSNFRFHDRNLLLLGVESRWPLFAHMDGAIFVDSGTVAPRVGDLGLDQRIYGFGARIHNHEVTLARLDVAHNEEGWHVLFRSSDPFALDRLKRWVAAVPFVP